jgi:hypothetical protein
LRAAVSTPLWTRAGTASRTPAPGRLSVRANRGTASSSLPIAANKRSNERSSGLRSKLTGRSSSVVLPSAIAAAAMADAPVVSDGAVIGWVAWSPKADSFPSAVQCKTTWPFKHVQAEVSEDSGFDNPALSHLSRSSPKKKRTVFCPHSSPKQCSNS